MTTLIVTRQNLKKNGDAGAINRRVTCPSRQAGVIFVIRRESCRTKDVIEERLFDKRRDLFDDLSAVFMDTTSLSFYGEGGETLRMRRCERCFHATGAALG